MMACRVCKISLMRYPLPDGTETLVHTRPWEDYDHDPDPVPASSMRDRKLVCDFCGELGSRWRYFGSNSKAYGQREDGSLTDAIQEIDGIWAACDGCDPYVVRGDVDGLVRRFEAEIIPLRKNKRATEIGAHWSVFEDPTVDQMTAGQRALWEAYLPTIYRRELIVLPKPLPPMRPAQMPKIRDRIVDFWRTDRALRGMRADAVDDAFIMLPGYLFDDDERFLVPTRMDGLTDDLLTRHIERVTHGLDAGELYWISSQFTTMAITAAKKLPDITIERAELPSLNGFVIWADPIYEIQMPDTRVPIRALAWTLIPDGVWVTLYIQPDLTPSNVDAEILRREIGFLMPWSAGGGAVFGTHEFHEDGGNMVLRVMVSTWLLMRQPGMTELTEEPVFADIKKKYKRAGRPAPKVHLVNLRKVERAARPRGEDQATRNYTGSWFVGWETGGFWRTYWTGPGRTVRDRRWIDPYVARADLPMKGEPGPKSTVKVLR